MIPDTCDSSNGYWVTQIIAQSYLQRLGIPKSVPETPKMEWVQSPDSKISPTPDGPTSTNHCYYSYVDILLPANLLSAGPAHENLP